MSQEIAPISPIEQADEQVRAEVSGQRFSHLRTIAARTLATLTLAVASGLALAESAQAASPHRAPPAPGQLFNDDGDTWAGYIASSPEDLDYVTDDFIVPDVTCPESGYYAVAVWAGLGGYETDDALYQTGIEIVCNDGAQTIQGWWEEVPGDGPTFYTPTISAGDKMVAEAVLNGDNVDVSLEDYGSDPSNMYPNWDGTHVISTESEVSPDTAECIVEDPIDSTTDDPDLLLDFGSIDFSTATSESFSGACDVTANDINHIISSSTPGINHGLEGTALDIEDSDSNVLADTSGLSADGEFTVTWDASS